MYMECKEIKEEKISHNNEIIIEDKKARKVFLEDLPKWGKEGRGNEGKINWKESIGHKVKFICEDIEGEVEIVGYQAKKQYLYIKYLNDEIFKIKTGGFQNCGLGNLLGVKTGKFKIKIGQILKNDKRDMKILDREYRKNEKDGIVYKWYKYKCNICNWTEGWMIEGSLLHGKGCACCCPTPRVSVEGINDIPTTAPWMIPYFQGGYDEAKLYTKGSQKKIYPICPDCERIKSKKMSINTIYDMHSIGCPCGDGQSYPFKLMFSVLEQLNIKFETEYNPDWIKPKRYDFYFELNEKKYIIEMDGGLGHGKRVHRLSGQSIEETQKIDDYKDLSAKENNVKVVRINCDKSNLDYIKNNIVNSKLNSLFNLQKVNWLKSEEFALGNLRKLACEIKKYNNDMTTTEIGNIMKLSYNTISSYLKIGNKLGWCNYDAKEETKKIASKNAKSRSKGVEIFKDKISLGIFENGHELEIQSEKLFNVKLKSGNIRQVCNGRINQYKGFTFRFDDKDNQENNSIKEGIVFSNEINIAI